MLAIALVLEGWDRKATAETCSMGHEDLETTLHRMSGSTTGSFLNQPWAARPPCRQWRTGTNSYLSCSGNCHTIW